MGLFDVAGQTNNYVVSKLINPSNVAGGTSVPGSQFGSTQVPVVTGLKLGPISTYLGGAQYSLIWLDPPPSSNVSHFNVYVTGVLSNNTSPIGPFAALASPCYLRLTATSASIITFYVQTVLNNGASSSLLNSPSCTGKAVSPTVAGTTQSIPGSATVTMNPSDYAIFLTNNTGGANLLVIATSTPTDGQQVTLRGTIPVGGNIIQFTVPTGQTVDTGATSSPGAGIAPYLLVQYSAVSTHWFLLAKN